MQYSEEEEHKPKLKHPPSWLIALIFLIFSFLLAYILRTYVIRVNGKSMYPILKNGDYVIIERGSHGDLVNKIVALRGRFPFVHRVIEEKEGYVLTKGDANIHSDGWIPREAIIGKVILIIPFWFIYSLLILLSILFFVCVISILFKLRKKKIEHSE